MAKFILTTNSNVKQHIKESGRYVEHCINDYITVGIQSKQVHPQTNICVQPNGDIIVMVGSYIYKETTGEEAMKLVYGDFIKFGPEHVKRTAAGMYSVCICQGDHVTVFNDYYGLYDVCYTYSEGTYTIGNALEDVIIGLPMRTLNENALIMEAFQLGAFPKDTIYKEVSKLGGGNFLIVDNAISIMELDDDYKISYKFNSETAHINLVATLMQKWAKRIEKCFGSVSMYMTGGLDSRLVFAAFNSIGCRINCKYGVGNGSQKGDRVIVDQICKYYQKDLELLDWSIPTEISPQKMFDEVGFYSYIAGGCKQHLDIFKNNSIDSPFYAFGYFCEAIRLRDWAEPKGRNFSLFDYIDNYYINSSIKNAYSGYDGYREYLISSYKEMLSGLGVSDNYDSIPIDLFERFRWMMARFCDSRAEYVLNNYSYAFSLMSIPEIHEAILALPADVIRGASFQIKLIDRLDHDAVTKFDVFSHLRPYRITKNLKRVKRWDLKTIADQCFKLLPFVKPLLIQIYRNKRYNTSNANAMDLKIINEHKEFIPETLNIDRFHGDLNRLKALIFAMYSVNKL